MVSFDVELETRFIRAGRENFSISKSVGEFLKVLESIHANKMYLHQDYI